MVSNHMSEELYLLKQINNRECVVSPVYENNGMVYTELRDNHIFYV